MGHVREQIASQIELQKIINSPLQRRTRVYLAGPISKGDVEQNVRAACKVATELMKMGYSVLCPHLTAYLQGPKACLSAGFEHWEWMEIDKAWVEVADVLFRIPGESSGADQEVEHATQHKIPVTTSYAWLQDNVPPRINVPVTQRSAGDPRFHAILQEMGDLHDRKQQDYGQKNDPFANLRSSRHWGVNPWIGTMIRLTDKHQRLQSFVQNGSLANEGVEDSLIDLANYSVIALVLYREQVKGAQS